MSNYLAGVCFFNIEEERSYVLLLSLSSSLQVSALESLSPNQKAELILDPDSGALENETIVKQVFRSLTESPEDDQLDKFFGSLAIVAKQVSV